MNAADIMSRPVITVREDATLAEVARTMLDHKIGAVLVVNVDGRLAGIVSESDFVGKERGVPFTSHQALCILGQWVTREGVEQIYRACRTMRARDIMTAPVETVTEQMSVTEIVRRMIRLNLKHLPVVRGDRPVGMVTHHDLLRIVAPAEASGADTGRTRTDR
jgi:CBS domain-containing protein